MNTKKNSKFPTDVDKTLKVDTIALHFSEIMKQLGLDLKDPSLKDTPKRVAKMFVNETCSALFEAPPKVTTFPNIAYDQMVIIKDIGIYSMCEHHFLPFFGKVHLGYIPNKEVGGLSKFNRIAKYYAAKPQLQERLTNEIAEYVKKVLKTNNVAVMVECTHLCVCSRGVKDINSTTVTSSLDGIFRGKEVRSEFFNLINN